jgi:RNA-directed DNA polymerase
MATVRTQSRGAVSPNLQRVKQAARQDGRTRFTALLHHVDVAALRRSFHRLRRSASAGVDGETVASYEPELEQNLEALHVRVHTGSYRPQPIRRVYIPKADGGRRPLGIPTLEDKIVQGAVAEVLNAIYEEDFLDCSFGFRPGRSPHDGLEALFDGLMGQPVNYVLDADIRSFFGSVDHELMLRALAVRIADTRVLRLIRQWLRVGILEGEECAASDVGTPQGAPISPLLANVYLHYALDVWAHRWKVARARGPMIYVRYADDFVMGFKHERDGQEMVSALAGRMGQCGLALHEQKTRLIEFGRFAAERRARRGHGRPETFDFLGLTHYCGLSRSGRFTVKRKTQGSRLRRKLKQLRAEAKRRMHEPVAEQHKWLCQVLRGHYAYFGVPCNFPSLETFWWEVKRLWHRALRRRDRKGSLTWERFVQLLGHFPLPRPRVTHPRHPAGAVVR